MKTPRRLHVVGRKNAGKTTLVCDLVRELSARGLRVATIKHTHHRHELDTPGKDSHRHREAGAAMVGILSPQMTAIFIPTSEHEDTPHAVGHDSTNTGKPTQNADTRYQPFQSFCDGCDLTLVEGDLHAPAPRLEVWREIVGAPPYAASDSEIIAVVTDDHPTLAVPLWPRADIRVLADKVLEFLRDTLATTS